ncbi:MAG: recombination protein RecR [Deltaproteobacteria bacterium]|nr:recombination protein RecR [Deltaproteobacteria bacterium]
MFAPPIARLIRELQRLPGVGEKTATRFALHVLKAPSNEAQALANALVEVKEKIRPCSACFQLTEADPCELCRSPRRDHRAVCVVEDQASLLAVEKARTYFGLYHVLGGHLSPMDGVGPEDLKIRELVDRVRTQGVEEVILATNPDVEGEATALYLKRAIEPLGVRVTRIARGVPVGGDLEFADALTLGRALEGRREY